MTSSTSDPPRLILVRHGAAEGAAGRCIGHHDLTLSAEGCLTSARLAATWSGAPPTRLIASDLARAASTAAILAERWELPCEPEPRLREMHFGAWEGLPWAEIDARDARRLRRWMANWTESRTPGGEGFPQLRARVARWVDDLREACGVGECVLVVAHAGSIRALLCHLLGLAPAQAFGVRLDHCRATALALGSQGREHAAELLYANSPVFPRESP